VDACPDPTEGLSLPRPQRLVAAPSRPAEQDALARVDCVECALQTAAVKQSVGPGGLRSVAPVGEADIIGEVVSLTIVGFDALHAEPQHALGLFAPPCLGPGGSEVHWGSGAHPPAPDVGRAVGVAEEVPAALAIGVVGRRLVAQSLGLRVGGALTVD